MKLSRHSTGPTGLAMLVPAARGHYKGSVEFLEGVSPATPSDPRPSHCMKLYYTLSRSYAPTPTMPLRLTTNTAVGRCIVSSSP
ncbi:hypothetical protein E2C01_058442 [Portunus trituberculatus]|uniref:Uncharacterized protein n=1 Tax=Portunus trituberculatus TaxID=210409 RepID=A0A5B7H305_PORTR|nr:hypothetical protein [Portunus trituberculatus]